MCNKCTIKLIPVWHQSSSFTQFVKSNHWNINHTPQFNWTSKFGVDFCISCAISNQQKAVSTQRSLISMCQVLTMGPRSLNCRLKTVNIKSRIPFIMLLTYIIRLLVLNLYYYYLYSKFFKIYLLLFFTFIWTFPSLFAPKENERT